VTMLVTPQATLVTMLVATKFSVGISPPLT